MICNAVDLGLGPVLGIETSCDETGVAIYSADRGIIGERLFSQASLHADYGGVVPELASRDHIRKAPRLIDEVLDEAGLAPRQLGGIAYTQGPGLVGALLVGAALGRAFAYALDIPAIGIHHMEGHLLAPLLEEPTLEMPLLALLVSGGHTQLVHARALGDYEVLGESLDDAAGEAFDKTAKLLGLGYPGGPALARLAETGDPERFRLPRPMTDRPGLDFSFSGLKTAVLTLIREHPGADEQTRADIARAFEEAVVDTLVLKCRRALEQTGLGDLVIAGGVSANARLRERLGRLTGRLGARLYYARSDRCTDNGAMIAYAGYLRLAGGDRASLAITVRPRWPLAELAPPTRQ